MGGEYVPFMFTVKDLVAKGQGSEFKQGFQWGGEYMVPSYRGGGFLDPKGRGMYTGYQRRVHGAAGIADGKEGQEELFKETNKVFDIGKGAIEMEVNKVNQDLGEIGGVFRQAAVGHRHGCQGAEDHPLEGYLLRQGGLSSGCLERKRSSGCARAHCWQGRPVSPRV